MSSPCRDFTVLSTFAGGGGSSLGYKMAGGKVVLAVEWDPKAALCYQTNFPTTPFYLGDIAELSVEEALRLSGMKVGELDILDGSPPCQGFSTAGKRVVEDPRNSLFREYVRLLRGLKPKAFVMENVSGLVKGKMRPVFRQIVTELKASGYVVKCRLLDAKWFGVPQERKRLIWVGAREDLGLMPEHPKAQTRLVTVREAIGKMVEPSTPRELHSIVAALVPLQPDKWSTDPGAYAKVRRGNMAGSASLQWAQWDMPVGTLIRSEIAWAGVVHPSRQRYLSVEEYQVLSSFPDSYVPPSDRKVAIMLFGNCVPPLLAKAVAEAVFDSVIAPARQQGVPHV
jgi:DNA (cytosine-5)-methyltransferase 1